MLLFFFVGVTNTAAAVLEMGRSVWADLAAFFSGAALTVFVAVEMVMMRSALVIQIFCLALGIAIVLESVVRSWRRRVALRQPVPAT